MQFSFTEERKSEISKKTSESKALHKKLKAGEISSRNFTEGTVFVFNIIMIITASILYFNNKIDFSEMVISITALVSSYGPVIALSNLSNNLAQTLASGDRVISLLEEEPVVAEIENCIDKNFDEIECKNLSFSYDSIKILDNISIKIEKNKITGILGKSGCGKSTLLKLIMRFWEIIKSAKQASIHQFISELPKGYDTPIGELGDRLSGGEKQRIGIARAFLSNAPVILLDEPTSNLDSLNEAIILKALHNAKDKTIILISHRKSTLAIADHIYSMESGRNS